MKNIVTLMNFVRGVEPRLPMDLYGTTLQQMELTDKYKLKTTYLLQYDAFIQECYAEFFRKKRDYVEIGLWLEIVKPQCEKVGVVWRGREGYAWDYHSHVSMVVGYDETEKTKLIDEAFSEFKKTFGFYPKTVGSWVLDSFSVNYMNEKYGIDAAFICREQWGTDGYSLFGGYYNQAYYPSKENILCPAQTQANGIKVPVFRLLGCDPIYQYASKIESNNEIFTLEPITWGDLKAGGSDKRWVEWYFENLFDEKRGGAFNYAQVGQENSFGWDRMKDGLAYQTKRIKELQDAGKITAMFVSEAGRWFKENFHSSPMCTQTALDDWSDKNKKSIWYYCKNYRANLLLEEVGVFIRDCHLFDERYPARYNKEVCVSPHSIFDNLPVINGLNWSDENVRAGLRLLASDGKPYVPENVSYRENGNTATVEFSARDLRYRVEFGEDGIEISADKDFVLSFKYAQLSDDEKIRKEDEKTVAYEKRGFEYAVKLNSGFIHNNDIVSENKKAVFVFERR